MHAFADEARYSPRAVGDLEAISNYLTERSPAGARAIELAIRATVALLELFPASGRALRQRPQVRVMPTPRFPLLIFYTSSADQLLILRIRHSARAPLSTDAIE